MNLNNYLNSFTNDENIKQELINYLALNNWFGYELKLNDGYINNPFLLSIIFSPVFIKRKHPVPYVFFTSPAL